MTPEQHRELHLSICLQLGGPRLLRAAKQVLADGLSEAARKELQAAVDRCDGNPPPWNEQTPKRLPESINE